MAHIAKAFGVACLVGAATAGAAPAEQQEGYFSDQTVIIAVGGTAGGGIDVGARLLAPYLGKYLPGEPQVQVQLMPGAGGVRLLDHLAMVAPKDGTYIGAFASGPLVDPIISTRETGYGISDFTAVGSTATDVSVCVTWHESGIATLDDARENEVTVAGTGAGSSTDTIPMVLNATLGTNFRVITGYVGTQESLLAMEQGEVDGRCGWSYASVQSSHPDWLEQNRINLLTQLGLEAHEELPDVPLALDLVTDEADRQLINVLIAPFSINRPFLAPDGLPEERVQEIRSAFESAMNDPEYRTEFASIFGQEPTPTYGEEMQVLLESIDATPPEVVARLQEILDTE